jgi:hypothetical protein
VKGTISVLRVDEQQPRAFGFETMSGEHRK